MTQDLIKHNYQPGEINTLITTAIANAEKKLNELTTQQDHTTILAFEQVMAELIENTKAAEFMCYIHPDPAIREESKNADNLLKNFIIEITSRKDIYDALIQTPDTTDPVQQRLKNKTLYEFKQHGMNLQDEERTQLKTWHQELINVEQEFEMNLTKTTAHITVHQQDLDGLPENYIARLKKNNEEYLITTNPADFTPFMLNAKNANARKQLQEKFENRAATENIPLLVRALELRKKIANTLGYNTWADLAIEEKMAQKTTTVQTFVENLKDKLAAGNATDLERLRTRKKQDSTEPLYPWDVAYYENQLRKEHYNVDDEKIRHYFPAQHVVKKMFEIYSTLFNISFKQAPTTAWAKNVDLYEIHDTDGTIIARFYTDFYPRAGKYEHAAAFTLRRGRLTNNKYTTPISAIVSNFAPAAPDTPPLLSHDEVETLFHEFGHIMHQTLTRAPYAFLSGTAVPSDFVEMPSQIMENWTWDATMLKKISQHHSTGEPLPDELIQHMIAARHFGEARMYTRQLLLTIFDLTLHTSKQTIDPVITWKKLYREITHLEPIENTHFPAGFGHIMGGYEAGYYSYLWSKVYADDLFTRFRQGGLLNQTIGHEYRTIILEQGDTQEPMILLHAFLGREPNNNAFLEMLGINNTS